MPDLIRYTKQQAMGNSLGLRLETIRRKLLAPIHVRL